MYKNHFGDDGIRENLLKKYSLLRVGIEYDPDRIFNLDNPEHYMVFKRTEYAYKQNSVYSSKLKNCECSDGVIINILFKNLKYGENYDAVEATIPTFELDDVSSSRMKAINEYQLCVKNDKMIKKIEDVTDTVDFATFYPRFLDFEKFKRSQGKLCRDSSKYVNGQKGGKYGKR